MQYAAPTQQQDAARQHEVAAATCEQTALDTVGNQARTEDAGLGAADVGDLGLLGEMADFVLDTLPLSLAIPVARAHADEPAVQRWADGVPLVDALRWVQDRADSALDAAWPAGTGLCAETALGGELGLGADLIGSLEILRTADDRLALQTHGQGKAGLDGAGAQAAASDAFGATVAELGAGGSLKLVVDRRGALVADFDVVELVQAGALAMAGSLAGLLLGDAAALVTGGPEGMMERWSDADWQLQDQVSVATSAGAAAHLEVGHGVELPADLAAQVPELAVLADLARGVLQAGGDAAISFLQGPEGPTLRVDGGLSVLASLATALPELCALPGWSALQVAAGIASDAVGLSLEVGLGLGADSLRLVPDGRCAAHLSRTQGDGTVSATDTLSCSLSQAAEALSAATPAGLQTLLAAGGTGWRRDVEFEVQGDRLGELVPSVAGRLRRLGLLPAVQTETTFQASGALRLGGDMLAGLAGLGITAPDGWTGAAAVRAIGESVTALRAGQPLPHAWLAPWAGALAELAEGLHLDAPRLRGTLRLGAGGGVDVPALGAEARAAGGVLVDQPLADAERDAVEAELSRKR